MQPICRTPKAHRDPGRPHRPTHDPHRLPNKATLRRERPARQLTMSSRLFSTHDSHTLLVDADVAHGAQLVAQLNHSGFRTHLAVDWHAAQVALSQHYYDSCIVVAHLDHSLDLEHLGQLRRSAQRVWILVLSDSPPDIASALAHRQDVDAVLSTPFSMHDLTSRLAAFSLRERPLAGAVVEIGPER